MIYSVVHPGVYRSTDRRARSIEIALQQPPWRMSIFHRTIELNATSASNSHNTPGTCHPSWPFLSLGGGSAPRGVLGNRRHPVSVLTSSQLFNYHPSFLPPLLSKYLDYRSLEHGRPDCHSFSLDQIMIPFSSASVTLSSFLCCSPEPPTSVHHGR